MCRYLSHNESPTIDCDDPLCLSCNPDDPSKCYSCDASVSGVTYNSASQSCVCAAGKYRDGDACSSCNSLCSECTGPTNRECVVGKCSSLAKAYPVDGTPTTCLYMCKTDGDNFFVNSTTKTCQRNPHHTP